MRRERIIAAHQHAACSASCRCMSAEPIKHAYIPVAPAAARLDATAMLAAMLMGCCQKPCVIYYARRAMLACNARCAPPFAAGRARRAFYARRQRMMTAGFSRGFHLHFAGEAAVLGSAAIKWRSALAQRRNTAGFYMLRYNARKISAAVLRALGCAYGLRIKRYGFRARERAKVK